MRLAAFALVMLLPAPALALPQFAVRESRRCDNCHIEPTGWNNPEIGERKCSLNCNSCHVNPTGAGMRNAAGRFFGKQMLPLFGERPRENAPKVPPDPLPSGGVATKDTQPSIAASQPARTASAAETFTPPPPGSDARYGGITAHPWVQIGGDLRLLGYVPFADDRKFSFFPMQAELYLAATPYNPEQLNHGRLTFLVNLALIGSRELVFESFADRLAVKEWWALFHDLPYQAYVKVGRFLPAFGWRLDDHTAFIRQEQRFTHQRQVTGIEIGMNPNYTFAHASFFSNTGDTTADPKGWRRFLVPDDGAGAAVHAGYRDLLWQAAGSFMWQNRREATDVWVGASWSLNFFEALHPWKGLDWVPLTYLGEFDVRRNTPHDAGARASTGLTAFHELDWLIVDSWNAKLRYDWQDPDVRLKDDHKHRVTIGFEFHPVTYLELIAQYRFNIEPAGVKNDEVLFQIHGWY